MARRLHTAGGNGGAGAGAKSDAGVVLAAGSMCSVVVVRKFEPQCCCGRCKRGRRRGRLCCAWKCLCAHQLVFLYARCGGC